MAKDVYYFSHDVNASNDPKIVAMESEFGVISYAWWWKLIEKLASSDDYRLPFKKYTFIALDKELGILNESERSFNENERPFNENERDLFCSNKSFLFINSLIHDFELLDCDDEYFWSPSLIRRQEIRRSKAEKKQEQRRLAGIKSGEARRKKGTKTNDRSTKTNDRSTVVEQNEQKERKGKESIYSYSYNEVHENEKSDKDILSMFDDESKKTDPYKNVFKIYMNDVGEISSVTKEKLECLVNDFGENEVINAISKSSEVGKASIAYITAVLNNKIREEAAKDNGTSKRNNSNRGSSRKGEQVDWQAEYERVHGRG
nr:MAG TPA: protein of unknown function (DUF4373) [Caudoviricetes sp.]